MRIFDAHIHYFSGSREDMMNILSTSPYKDMYFIYHSVNLDCLNVEPYLKESIGAFLIPFILKETDVRRSNHDLFAFSKSLTNNNIYPIPLIDDNDDCLQYIDMTVGAKEHFILHNAFACEARANAYKHLNKSGKFLILHCGDIVRDNYVDYLLRRYDKMKIVLAHLGANRKDNSLTQKTILKFSKNSRVYFDTSTILDVETIKYACSTLPIERILFGTDMPFIVKNDPISEAVGSILNLDISEENKMRILYQNAQTLVSNLK